MNTQKIEALSDKKADSIATKMMDAMGGIDKWNDLKYVSWTFFGARHLVWDKENGRVRIDSPRDTSVFLVNINTLEGKVLKGGKVIRDSLELTKQLSRAKSIWINDSYWLFMPFKLWDPGVNVSYVREDTLTGGAPSSVLALTFENVGITPDNKYEVYIDHKDDLIKQWAFFKTATQEEPPRVWPWDNYKEFGGLMLSQDRSDKSGPSNVRVYETLDDIVFESLEPFDYF
ncbi:MAG: hypothetical protein P1U56_03585 [Saprospiraceae bacterium]|nr:hypothetical protein [Saprospiraceae bacterium]